MLKQLLLVGVGGAAGSMLRFLTSILTSRFYNGAFPLATLIINIVGCFLIGLVMAKFAGAENNQLRLLLVTGFCGGYTTFSAFSYENITLFNTGNALLAITYMAASIFGGILAVWLGTTAA
jgi:CrcB protein